MATTTTTGNTIIYLTQLQEATADSSACDVTGRVARGFTKKSDRAILRCDRLVQWKSERPTHVNVPGPQL